MKIMEEIAQDLNNTKLTEDLGTQYDKLIESLQKFWLSRMEDIRIIRIIKFF